MRRRHVTTGDMISTLCFLGVGFWMLSAASEAELPKSLVLYFCGALSFTGAARFPIARLYDRFTD